MRSKIKKIFPEEVLKYIGSICDTKRIDSAKQRLYQFKISNGNQPKWWRRKRNEATIVEISA
jgi:hypothetical protein